MTKTDVLSSWKEIAEFMGKGVRTVQRWEHELGLPVRRPNPGSRRIVLTTRGELSSWLQQQETRQVRRFQPGPHYEQFERMQRLLVETAERAQRLQANAKMLMAKAEVVKFHKIERKRRDDNVLVSPRKTG